MYSGILKTFIIFAATNQCFSPLFEYHSGLLIKSWTSLTIRSEIPSSRTTELSGLGFLGLPNCRHSEPYAVYIIVFPSFCFTAKSRAVVEFSVLIKIKGSYSLKFCFNIKLTY